VLRLAQKECFLYVLIFKCINRKLKCEYTYDYDFSFEEKYLIIGFQAFMFFREGREPREKPMGAGALLLWSVLDTSRGK